MGAYTDYPEDAPEHWVEVDSFAIDAAPVTNAEFSAFVEATGHITLAETGRPLKIIPMLCPMC
jgi:formylglycine-generating enzyme